MSKLKLARDVTIHRQESHIILFKDGPAKFLALNQTSHQLLQRSMAIGEQAAIEELAKSHRVSREVVARDWLSLRDTLLCNKYLEVATDAALPSLRYLAWLLSLAACCCRFLPWSFTLWLWNCEVHASRTLNDAKVIQLDEMLRHVAAGHFFNPECKERSLVAWRLLKQLGVPTKLVIGLRFSPFGAHAWVDAGGKSIGDTPENCAPYTIIRTYP